MPPLRPLSLLNAKGLRRDRFLSSKRAGKPVVAFCKDHLARELFSSSWAERCPGTPDLRCQSIVTSRAKKVAHHDYSDIGETLLSLLRLAAWLKIWPSY